MNKKIVAFADLEKQVLLVDEDNTIYKINKSDLKVADDFVISISTTLPSKKVKVPKQKLKELLNERD